MKAVGAFFGIGLIVLLLVWAIGAVKAGLLIRDARVAASAPDEPALDAFSREKAFVDVGPWRVAYIDRGHGEPVVLLHGCPFQSYRVFARHPRARAPLPCRRP